MQEDRRIVTLQELSEQEIKSRLHIIGDRQLEIQQELIELHEMMHALDLELEKRKLAKEVA